MRGKRFAEVFPRFSREFRNLVERSGSPALLEQLDQLAVHDRCRCADSFCATFYTAPLPSGPWPPPHENVDLEADEGYIILDLVDARIVCVEVLYRDDVQAELFMSFPPL